MRKTIFWATKTKWVYRCNFFVFFRFSEELLPRTWPQIHQNFYMNIQNYLFLPGWLNLPLSKIIIRWNRWYSFGKYKKNMLIRENKLKQNTKCHRVEQRHMLQVVCPWPSNDNPGTRVLEAFFSTRLPG